MKLFSIILTVLLFSTPNADASPIGFDVAQNQKYRYEVVHSLATEWQSARNYCLQRGGDLIQQNPKLYTLQGRKELAESLNLPRTTDKYGYYHTGIKRDANQVWRRASDGVQVELDGWMDGRNVGRNGHEFLYWSTYDNENTIYDMWNVMDYFICEY